MSHKIASRRPRLQANVVDKHESSVTGKRRRRRRITRPFVALPVGYVEQIPARLQPLFLLLWSWDHGRPVTEHYRVLAARLKRDMTTVQKQVYALEALGKLRVTRVKVSRCRNGANTFHFCELDGFIVEETHCENAVEILKETLNTSTTAQRASAPPVSYSRLRWEFTRRDNHPPAMKALHEQNAALIGELRTLRHRSTGNRWRSSGEATLGMYGIWRGAFTQGPSYHEDLQARIAAEQAAITPEQREKYERWEREEQERKAQAAQKAVLDAERKERERIERDKQREIAILESDRLAAEFQSKWGGVLARLGRLGR
jgi:hypothetical protein